jgi:ribosome assembly protein RRB1
VGCAAASFLEHNNSTLCSSPSLAHNGKTTFFTAPAEADRTKTDEEGMGEFEDQWEDEFEEDGEAGEVIDAAENEDDEEGEEGGMDVDEPEPLEEEQRAPSPIPFLPTGVLEEGEFLQPDLSTYPLLHSFVPTWPSLSFDILRDNGGEERRGYPVSCALVSGTQSMDRTANEITVMRWEGLGKTRKEDGGAAPGFSGATGG